MSVTKISVHKNLNQLQQDEMHFVMFTFIAPSNTTWSTVHAYCIISWTFEDIASSAYVKTLAYITGTTSKHQEPRDLNI